MAARGGQRVQHLPLKRFFDQIPTDLIDAASIDGAGRLRTLWSVVLPLSRPVLAVTSIFSVIATWKDFLWPMLVLQDPQVQTLSVGAVPADDQQPGGAQRADGRRSILSGLSAGALKE